MQITMQKGKSRVWFFLLICLFTLYGLSACRESSAQSNEAIQTNGEFHATLLIMKEADLTEFEKPSDQTLQITTISEARIGDRVALKLIFVNIQLTKESVADVTFDIEVLRPDGTPSKGGVHKDLPAMQSKVGAQSLHNVFNSNATPVIEFEPGDQHGIYDISVIVKDNVGNQQFKIKEEIELLE